MGKRIVEAREEADLSSQILDYYGRHGPALAAPRPLESDAGDAVLLTEPLGPLLTVQPWNYPLYQVARIAAPNLVLGNTILLKHASSCPQSALALEQVFREAGVPAGVFTNLFLETGDIADVIESPRVHGVSLTGSEGAGAPVAEQAGRNLKKSVLELGGSDPFIVLDAERLERTVDAAVKGRLENMARAAWRPSASSSSTSTTTRSCPACAIASRRSRRATRPTPPRHSPRCRRSARRRPSWTRSRTQSPRARQSSSAAGAPTFRARSSSRPS